MMAVSAQAPQKGSRLIQYFSDLVVSDVTVSHKRFAEKLGDLIDLSDSFSLSDSLRGLKRTPFEAKENNDNIQNVFIGTRSIIMEAIIKSFVADTGNQPFQLPRPNIDTLSNDESAFEPYRRFYASHQSEIELQLLKLRAQVRESISGYSSELAQLAALDTALGDMLSVHSRKLFSSIPKLLAQRFHHLRQQQLQEEQPPLDSPERWSGSDGWLGMFLEEMQGLLLAELEVRLLPVIGLIEAFNEETEKEET